MEILHWADVVADRQRGVVEDSAGHAEAPREREAA
jgi:hypothetical protein